jgi:hypothetical protein
LENRVVEPPSGSGRVVAVSPLLYRVVEPPNGSRVVVAVTPLSYLTSARPNPSVERTAECGKRPEFVSALMPALGVSPASPEMSADGTINTPPDGFRAEAPELRFALALEAAAKGAGEANGLGESVDTGAESSLKPTISTPSAPSEIAARRVNRVIMGI